MRASKLFTVDHAKQAKAEIEVSSDVAIELLSTLLIRTGYVAGSQRRLDHRQRHAPLG